MEIDIIGLLKRRFSNRLLMAKYGIYTAEMLVNIITENIVQARRLRFHVEIHSFIENRGGIQP